MTVSTTPDKQIPYEPRFSWSAVEQIVEAYFSGVLRHSDKIDVRINFSGSILNIGQIPSTGQTLISQVTYRQVHDIMDELEKDRPLIGEAHIQGAWPFLLRVLTGYDAKNEKERESNRILYPIPEKPEDRVEWIAKAMQVFWLKLKRIIADL